MALKNTYAYRYNKTIKDFNKLNMVHENEIKHVKDHYKSELKNILNKISTDLNIPMTNLTKYNKLLDHDISNISNINADIQITHTQPLKKPDVLIKTSINDQIYYVNNVTSIIYKTSIIGKENISTQVGIIDSNGNFLLDS